MNRRIAPAASLATRELVMSPPLVALAAAADGGPFSAATASRKAVDGDEGERAAAATNEEDDEDEEEVNDRPSPSLSLRMCEAIGEMSASRAGLASASCGCRARHENEDDVPPDDCHGSPLVADIHVPYGQDTESSIGSSLLMVFLASLYAIKSSLCPALVFLSLVLSKDMNPRS
eukprot:gene614-337_t